MITGLITRCVWGKMEQNRPHRRIYIMDIPTEPVDLDRRILIIRGQSVMLDRDLAKIYGVPTKILKRAVRRNQERFPEDFMFPLTEQEVENLRCQFGTSSWGGHRYLPFAFTEHAAMMLAFKALI